MKLKTLVFGFTFFASLVCGAYENRDCQSVAANCGPMVPGKFCPQCDPQNPAKWMPMQCYGSTGYCWCVNTDTGAQVSDPSRNPNLLNCKKNF